MYLQPGAMVLVNSFEETFGNTYDPSKGVWGALSETISKDLSRSVVSLASYHGELINSSILFAIPYLYAAMT
jgi:hypothetical protein